MGLNLKRVFSGEAQLKCFECACLQIQLPMEGVY